MTSNSWQTIENRLKKIKPPVHVLRLCQDPETRDRYHKATQAADTAAARLTHLKSQPNPDPDAVALLEKQHETAQAALKTAQQAYEEATVTLRFQALERQELEDLQRKHHASEEDEAEGRDIAFDDFAPALIAAASLDDMPEEYAREALNTWPTADADDLWAAAWTVQRVKRTDLGKG